MGMIYSALCMISFCFERVLTWACCACALMTLLSVIMLLMVYGISIGYGYAQQELAGFAKKSREHLTNVSVIDIHKNPQYPHTPLRRRRRAGTNTSAVEYQPGELRAPQRRSPVERSYPLHEVSKPIRNHRRIGVPRKAPDNPVAPDAPPEVQEHPKASYGQEAPEVQETPYIQKASYSRKASAARNAPYAQETPDIPVATYSRQISDAQEAPYAPEAPHAQEALYAPEAPNAPEAPYAPEASYAQEVSYARQPTLVQEPIDAREIPDSQEPLDERDASYSRESPAAPESPDTFEAPEAVETDVRSAPVAKEILDAREIPDPYAYSRTQPSPIIILPTERPPEEPEMLPHEKELARKIIGRVRRSKISKHLTV